MSQIQTNFSDYVKAWILIAPLTMLLAIPLYILWRSGQTSLG